MQLEIGGAGGIDRLVPIETHCDERQHPFPATAAARAGGAFFEGVRISGHGFRGDGDAPLSNWLVMASRWLPDPVFSRGGKVTVDDVTRVTERTDPHSEGVQAGHDVAPDLVGGRLTYHRASRASGLGLRCG